MFIQLTQLLNTTWHKHECFALCLVVLRLRGKVTIKTHATVFCLLYMKGRDYCEGYGERLSLKLGRLETLSGKSSAAPWSGTLKAKELTWAGKEESPDWQKTPVVWAMDDTWRSDLSQPQDYRPKCLLSPKPQNECMSDWIKWLPEELILAEVEIWMSLFSFLICASHRSTLGCTTPQLWAFTP